MYILGYNNFRITTPITYCYYESKFNSQNILKLTRHSKTLS